MKSQKVKSENYLDICVKPTWRIHLLRSLQVHYFDREFFILDWNESSE